MLPVWSYEGLNFSQNGDKTFLAKKFSATPIQTKLGLGIGGELPHKL